MKILLVTNRTLSNRHGAVWEDGGYWNLFVPLVKMGHEVAFYDTVRGDERVFSNFIDKFKPELIFCCMTGDPRLTPGEPWEELVRQTEKGNCKTFNWFCDDAWRFENFSSKVCHAFHVCSTPEIGYIQKFKEIGYQNIILGFWYSNIECFPKKTNKKTNIAFCGQLSGERKAYIEFLNANGAEVSNYHGLSHIGMLEKLAEARIGINFSMNNNARPPVLQMKARMVEVPAANSMLLTQYAPGLEHHFVPDQEIITFEDSSEMLEKAKFFLNRSELAEKIALKGHERFLKEHESTVRLRSVIEKVMKL